FRRHRLRPTRNSDQRRWQSNSHCRATSKALRWLLRSRARRPREVLAPALDQTKTSWVRPTNLAAVERVLDRSARPRLARGCPRNPFSTSPHAPEAAHPSSPPERCVPLQYRPSGNQSEHRLHRYSPALQLFALCLPNHLDEHSIQPPCHSTAGKCVRSAQDQLVPLRELRVRPAESRR